MAAFETPWLSEMSKSTAYAPTPTSPQANYDHNPPTIATFSPSSTSGYTASASKQRSTIIVHKKSPLLVATPPQITRALAHSHPFLLPLNKLVGLISWQTDDPWESYLLVAVFWALTLYGDTIIRFASPVIVVTLLILGMYSRRYSPLSSTSRTGEKHTPKSHKREPSEVSSSPHHKSLDEIVDTLHQFTTRCNILLGPFITLTDFLSTQQSPTSATTRPALTTLFIRILLITPLWVALTLPPFYIITTRRVLLFIGTTILSWHSRPARVTRAILWRSVFMRQLSSFITGLSFPSPSAQRSTSNSNKTSKSQSHLATITATNKRPSSSGVRFTFILYENQRRWIGLGWTTSLFAYERSPWTDENFNPAPSKDEFELPDVDGGTARWRWLEGREWRIERGDAKQHSRNTSTGSRTSATGSNKDDSTDGDGGGWIYYDNRWEDGRREDGWGRYTRRRKWYRDAELVEITPSMQPSPIGTPKKETFDEKDFPLSMQKQKTNEKLEKLESQEDKIKRAREYARSLTPTSPAATTAAITIPTSTSNPTPTTTIPEDPDTAVTSARSPASASASASAKKRAGWFGRGRERSDSKSSSSQNTGVTQGSTHSRDGPEDDVLDQYRDELRGRGFSLQEDVAMSLG